MDLKTSFVFYLASMTLYVSVLTAMALADKRVIGTRWLAYAVLVEMLKTVLQLMAPSIPRLISTMVANELNIIAFFAMYMGLRWFVRRDPLPSRAGPAAMLVLMGVYCWMFVRQIPYASVLISAAVLWICVVILRMLWKQNEERFRIPAAITSVMLLVLMGVVAYRAMLAVKVYQSPVANWRVAQVIRGGTTRCWRW